MQPINGSAEAVLKYVLNKPSSSVELTGSHEVPVRMALFSAAMAFLFMFSAYR